MGLDVVLIWCPVIKSLVRMHLWCKQEAATSNHYRLKAKCNLFQENWTLIHKIYGWGHTDLIYDQEVQHDNRCLTVCLVNDSCNDNQQTNKHKPIGPKCSTCIWQWLWTDRHEHNIMQVKYRDLSVVMIDERSLTLENEVKVSKTSSFNSNMNVDT